MTGQGAPGAGSGGSGPSGVPPGVPGAAGARRRFRVLAAPIALTTSGALPAFLTGALGVQIKADLGVGDTGLGLAVAALFGAATLLAAVTGRLADRLGWQRAVRMVAACLAASLAGIAVFGGSYPALVGFLVVGGFGFAMTTPAANLVLARTVPSGRRGFAFGIQQAAVPLSTLLAGLSVPAIALTVGWRWAFAVAVLLPISAALLVPRVASGTGGRRAHAPRSRFVVPPALLLLAAAGALSAVSIGALHGFSVVSAVNSGIGEGAAGLLVAAASLAGIAVRVVAGWAVDRVDTDGFRRVAVMLGLGAAGYLLLASQSAPLVVPGMLLAYGAGWGWPGLFQYGVVETFPAMPGSATGVIQTGFAGGTALGPLVFGVLADTTGYGWSWLVIAACTVAAAVLIDIAATRLRTTLST